MPFRAAFYPWGTYASVAANIFLVFFQGYTAFLNPFSASDFVINYILLAVFVLFVVGYKVWKKTKWVKLHEMDIWSGRRTYDDKPRGEDSIRGKKTWWTKVRDVVIG